MAEYSRIARGSFTATTGLSQVIYLPFQPTIVSMTNYSAYGSFANHGIPQAYWDVGMGQGTAAIQLVTATPSLRTDNVTSNGISTFGAGISLLFGKQEQIASITGSTSPTTINTMSAHGYNVGDVVIFEGLFSTPPTAGMPQICGIPFQILTVPSTTSFTISWDTSGDQYTNLSGNPAGAYVKKVLSPFLYLPGENVIAAISTGATTTITTTTNHNYVVGQSLAFRIPSQWGTTQLNSLPNNLIPGSPIYGYVTSVLANNQFVCNIDSTNFTAFFVNIPVAQVFGLTPPQVVAVGDVNSGGTPYSGGALYPSPTFPTYSGGMSTINGPAISGAFVNNTRQGFIIGAGSAATDSMSNLSGATGNKVFWEATFCDFGN